MNQIINVKVKIEVIVIILLSLFSVDISSGQKSNNKITITGSVLDATQRPVMNAIIMIDGIRTNYFTDPDGNYKIKVKRDAEKLGIFTFSNGIIEEPISGRTIINFTLGKLDSQKENIREDASGEEEISVGYGTVKKKDLTTQVNKIDGTNKKYASYSSIYDMIRGELAGVQVVGKSIKVQGANSFNLSTEPLLVIDGMVVSSIDDIPPQMVKSIEVLKGSSASIYGSRGANGVIIITLLNGSER